MLAGNAVYGRQTETCAAPLLFRREKRLKNPLQRLAVHARTAVSERKGRTVHGTDLVESLSRQPVGINFFGTYRKSASTRHRMLRIDGQVHHDLLDLAYVSLNHERSFSKCFFNGDILRQRTAKKGQKPPYDGVEVQHPEIKRLATTECKQLADQVAGTDPCAVDGPDILQTLIIRTELRVKNLGISENRRQKVI
ncbi:MAG: hypothetical protein A3K90_06525 [Pelodictyon luteolum]|uniref:Uncharacterized protein n=1 Tax=Pelodictyon luteolum TaxID=1100 RepID=A0A165LRF9_PELLU|nr:hypothetical protein [Pelodictyon luteolum]KZK74335.1 MAG: hypothetical protein A3K90_06525 [Pelodictyon luteolum]